MLWFYSQNDRTARVETRYDNHTSEYVLIVLWPDERRQEERFATAVLFRQRLMQLETQLAAERWSKDGSPAILPDAWPDRRPAR